MSKLSEINYYEFGARICQYRKRAKLSQHKLADQLGISYQHMSNIERGHAKPSLELAVKIAKVLDIDLNVLLGEDARNYNMALSQEIAELLEGASYVDIQICYALCKAYLKTKDEHNR